MAIFAYTSENYSTVKSRITGAIDCGKIKFQFFFSGRDSRWTGLKGGRGAVEEGEPWKRNRKKLENQERGNIEQDIPSTSELLDRMEL